MEQGHRSSTTGQRVPLRRRTLAVAWLTGAAALGAYVTGFAVTGHAAPSGSATARTAQVALSTNSPLLAAFGLSVSTTLVTAPSTAGTASDTVGLAADNALISVGTQDVSSTATRSDTDLQAASRIASASVSFFGTSVLSTGVLSGTVDCPAGGPATAATTAAGVSIGGQSVDATAGATASVAVTVPAISGAKVTVTVGSPHTTTPTASATGLQASFTLTGTVALSSVSIPLGSISLAAVTCTPPTPAAPTVTSLAPTSGPVAGGTPVTIRGTGFGTAPTVSFGGVAATAVSVNADGSLSATTPAHAAGAVDVVVTGPGGSTTDPGAFTYVAAPAPPTVTGLTPDSGPVAGGTAVSIDGTGFGATPTVSFDGVAGTVTSADPDGTHLVVATPAHAAGAVDVVVTGPGGSATDAGAFTYVAGSPAAPTVSSIDPTSGPVAGGTPVTIHGTGFGTAPEVSFGGVAATAVSVDPDGTISATTPAHAAGAVDVVVTTADGSGTLPSGFTYLAAPAPTTVSGLAPDSGPVAGGTSVLVQGTGFGTAPSVTFDGVGGTVTSVAADGTQLEVTTPAHAAGAVDVAVTGPGGSAVVPAGYTYVDVPVLSGLAPTSGPVAGGQRVTLSGTHLGTDPAVTFDGVPATAVTPNPDGTVTVTTPAHAAGPVDVVLTTAGGASTLAGGYTYVDAPTVTDLDPATGPVDGGTSVLIDGTGFGPAPTVTFGGVAGTVTAVDAGGTQLLVTTPPHAPGAVDVTVTGPGGTVTAAGAFTYTADVVPAPAVSGVDPDSGPVAGGQVVTISGSHLTAPATVTFGGVPATDVVVNADGTVTATTPAHAAGAVDVAVTTDGGTGTLPAGYTYDATPPAAPTVTSIDPVSGPVDGGTAVMIGGTGFGASPSVTFDGLAGTVTFVGADGTQLTVTTPAHPAGPVDVTVSADGGSAAETAGFTYVADAPVAPAVSGVDPDSGPVAGGQVVTISGSHLTAPATVTFGGVPATDVVVNADGTVTATTPAHAAGAVDVAVTTDGGTGTLPAGYTYDATPPAAPTVTSIDPISGPVAGGQVVTIAGTHLTAPATVTFDGIPATDVAVGPDGTISATTPAHPAGTVDVTVSTEGGSATLDAGYRYVADSPAAPTVTGLAPDSGPTAGGTSVLVGGTGFGSAPSVTVDGLPAVVTSVSADGTQLMFTTPAHAAGAVDVVVSTDGGSARLAGGFTYVAPPTLTGVDPAQGPVAGGQVVTLTGAHLTAPATVTIGGEPATDVTVNADGTVSATTPAHAAGVVDVTVTTPGGTTTLPAGYTYLLVAPAAPTVSGLAPDQGPAAGGTSVVIDGSGFGLTPVVTFDGLRGTLTQVDPGGDSLVVTTPAHPAGAVDVVVSTVGGSATATAAFTYLPAPTLTGLDPNAGPTAGGQVVTLTGVDLGTSPRVTFDGLAAGDVTVHADGSVTVTTPAHAVGAVDVVLTTGGGTSTLARAYTYVAGADPRRRRPRPRAGRRRHPGHPRRHRLPRADHRDRRRAAGHRRRGERGRHVADRDHPGRVGARRGGRHGDHAGGDRDARPRVLLRRLAAAERAVARPDQRPGRGRPAGADLRLRPRRLAVGHLRRCRRDRGLCRRRRGDRPDPGG